jgi:hypothetical protein
MDDVIKAGHALAGGAGLSGYGTCGALSGGMMSLSFVYGRAVEDIDKGRFLNSYRLAKLLYDRFLNPSILGTQNQTQIISSIRAGGSLGSQIKQTANLMTAVICKTTGNKPASVCGQDSITALTDSLVSYTPPTTSESTTAIPEFPVQLGLALLVTVAIVASYVVARRITLSRTGPKSGPPELNSNVGHR